MQKALSNLKAIVVQKLESSQTPEMVLKLCYFAIAIVQLPHALSQQARWFEILTSIITAMERLDTTDQIQNRRSSWTARECLGRIQQVETGVIAKRRRWYDEEPEYSFEIWGDIDAEYTVFSAKLIETLGHLGGIGDNPGIQRTVHARRPKDKTPDAYQSQTDNYNDNEYALESANGCIPSTDLNTELDFAATENVRPPEILELHTGQLYN